MMSTTMNEDRVREPRREAQTASERQHWVLGRTATVAAVHADRVLLDDGHWLAVASGCLLRPAVGDQVLVSAVPALLLMVLSRPTAAPALLQVPQATELRLEHDQLSLTASTRLRLRAGAEVELSVATGALRMQARNLFLTVLETLVETAQTRVSRLGALSTTVSGLLRLHSRHGMVTADKQLRIDAEQVHVG